MSLILAIDQSTSLTKAMLFNELGELKGRYDVSHKSYVNDLGWVEHDMDKIYENMILAVKGLLAETKVDPSIIKSCAITNQRETTVAFDKKTGKSIYHAIVWQCGRAKEICEKLADKADVIKEKSGMNLSPYFSAAKMNWIMENIEEAKILADKKELALSTVDAYLIYRLSGLTKYKSEYSNACRTQLFNIGTLEWDKDLLSYFNLDISMMPEVCDSDSLFCYTTFEGIFETPISIHSVLADSQSALFAQGGNRSGIVKATYGTGSSVMANVGAKKVFSNSLVTSIGWKIKGELSYVLEGNINNCGATTKWLVESLGILDDPKNASKIAKSVTSKNNVYLVPSFSGLGAPYWNSNSRAIIYGMDRTTGKNEIIKAGEEAIGYQINDILLLMQEEGDIKIESLKVDGGITNDSFVMQFQSDISKINIDVSAIEELSALGTAVNAAIAINIMDFDYFDNIKFKKSYSTTMDEVTRAQKLSGWKVAVKKVLED